MVSIANVSGHQGTFSDLAEHDHSHNIPDVCGSKEHLVRSPILNSATLHPKDRLIKHFPGVCVIVLYILSLITFEVMIFVCYDILHLKILGGIEEPLALLIVMHVAVWVLTFVYDRYMHFHHHALRKYGYLNLFMETKELRRVPMMIFSLGNAALLLVLSFMSDERKKPLSLIRIFQLVTSIEVALALVAKFIYLAQVLRFNRRKKMPDVYNNDITGSIENEINNTPEVGFSNSDDLDDVLEKQSEMIQYLQQHNTTLSRRIIDLTQLLPKEEQRLVLNTSNVNPNLYSQRVT